MKLESRADYEQYISQTEDGEYIALLEGFTLRSVFQPIQDKRQNLTGYEALLRATNSDGESLRPDLLLVDPQLPEATKVAIELLSRTIHIRNFANFLNQPHLSLFLNVKPNSLLSLNTMISEHSKGLLSKRLFELGIKPEQVVFEVVEDPCFDDQELKETIQNLKYHRYQFAIDDFGAKCSDKRRVQETKPHIVKIDRSYLLKHCDGETNLIPEVIAMAKEINAQIIIEGVEEEHQFEKMLALGIEGYQGYFFAKPQSAIKFV